MALKGRARASAFRQIGRTGKFGAMNGCRNFKVRPVAHRAFKPTEREEVRSTSRFGAVHRDAVDQRGQTDSPPATAAADGDWRARLRVLGSQPVRHSSATVAGTDRIFIRATNGSGTLGCGANGLVPAGWRRGIRGLAPSLGDNAQGQSVRRPSSERAFPIWPKCSRYQEV